MSKIYLLRSLFLLFAIIVAKVSIGQTTVQIGTGTDVPANTLYSPVYRFTATSTTTGSRANILYTQAELAAVGITAGASISSVSFNKTNAANFVTPATYTMYVGNTSNTALATSLTWASIMSTHTQVYTSSSFNFPLAAGWVTINFSSPFIYTGGSLEIANECSMVGNGGATDMFKWEYTTGNDTKIVGVSSATGATLNGAVAAYKQRPNIQITFTGTSACTSPPTPGTSTANPTTAVCIGTSVGLNLSGNSSGTGQTYQWQTAPSASGPWTNVGTSATSANTTISPTVTAYYQCVVTCGTSSLPSTPVQVLVNPGLAAGSYTINPTLPATSTNFQTFNAAVNALGCGIAGSVAFHVYPATYNEQVVIPQIGGASASKTITFFGHGAIISDNSLATTAERAVIKLNGADFITLDSLIINAGSGTYGYGIQLLNDADSNTISRCDINIGNTTSTSTTNYAGILINSTASAITTLGDSKCDGNTIIANNVSGGYAGIALVANGATNTINANKILKNTVTDFYLYGIYVNGNTNLLVDSNSISRPKRSTVGNFDGIYFTGVSTNCMVSRNMLSNAFKLAPASTSAMFAIYFTACDATAGNENIVANNIVFGMIGATGNQNGLLNNSSDYLKVYHNSFLLDDATAAATCDCAARGIYVQTTTVAGLDIRNNIISVSRGGVGEKQGVYFEPTSIASYTLDNNNYFITGSGTVEIGHIGTTGYTTLSSWQTGSSKEAASKTEDPMFVNASVGNLKPGSSLIDNMGTPVGITSDILSLARSTVSPDAGAYEFTTITAGLNMGVDGLVSPVISSTGCYGAAETVTVRIRNSSTAIHNFVTNPVTVNISVSGAATQSFPIVLNTGTLASNATMDVTVPTTLNMTSIGTYTFNAATVLVGDANTTNDAMPAVTRNKVFGTSGIVSVSPNSYCVTGGMPVLSATGTNGYSSLQWQSSSLPTSGFTNIASATTNPFTLTSNVTQTTYYRLLVVCKGNQADSAVVMLTYNNPSVVSTVPATRCGSGTVNLSATPSSGQSISWYAAATGGVALATGNTFTTPVISSTTTYYAAASNGGSISSTGMAASLSTATSGAGTTNFGLVFDALVPFTLTSVVVYPVSASSASGSVIIDVIDGSGTVLHTATASVTGSPAASPSPHTINLNFNILPGTNYKLRPRTMTGISGLLFEPSASAPSGNYGYPYIVPGVLSINTSTLTAAPTNTTRNDLYYYFYNWQVSTGCESARTAVLATVDCNVPITLLDFKGEKQGAINKLSWTTSTEINNAGFELQRSTDGTNFGKLGFINSKAVNGSSNLPLTYSYNDERPLLSNGYYRLKQVDKDGKSSYSPIVLIKAGRVSSLVISSIYPNPVKESLGMTILSPINDMVTVLVTDITGKVLLRKQSSVQAGSNNLQLDVKQLAAGSYFVKILCSNGCETAVQKFLK
jgi:hypothetical protein